jgi:hypothetical protein
LSFEDVYNVLGEKLELKAISAALAYILLEIRINPHHPFHPCSPKKGCGADHPRKARQRSCKKVHFIRGLSLKPKPES